jgi:hypothetical protein
VIKGIIQLQPTALFLYLTGRNAYMPFSFTGYSSTALIIMVLFLAIAQAVKHFRHKSH